EIVRNILYVRMGWDKMTPIDTKFWTKFGSSCGVIDKVHKKIYDLKERFGAKGTTEIFGERFSKVYGSLYRIQNLMQSFDNVWKKFQEIEEMKKPQHSPYDTLDQIEEEVTVKNAKREAEKFYLDRSKNWKERLKVFRKYGTTLSSIHHPTDGA